MTARATIARAGMALAAAGLAVALAGCSKDDRGERRKEGSERLRRAKSGEAEDRLRALERSLAAWFAAHGAFPAGAAPPTPAVACCDAGQPGRRCPVDPAAWSGPPWTTLGFSVDEPHLYQYAYESDGATVTARAIGDLDCDGEPGIFELRGRVEGGAPVFELIAPPRPE